MKLALIVPGGVDRSGVERVVPALLWQIERMAQRYEVHVFALAQGAAPEQWELLGATVHSIGTDSGRRRRFLQGFAREHARGRFDVIHAFWGGSGTYAALAAVRHRIPFALHLAGGELVALTDIGYGVGCSLKARLLLRATIAAAQRVTVASDYMQELARQNGYNRIERVPLGVALDRWPPRAPRGRDASQELQLLHIGDIRPVKGQELLLQAMRLVREAGVDFRLDIAGHDTMRGVMHDRARQLGLGSHIAWHGVLRRDALRALVDRADLLVVTSRHDAGPLAFLEAAVAGVPAVGTAVGHLADWAPHAAVSIPSADAAQLAAAIIALIEDEPRRLAIATVAQRRAIAIDADHTAAAFTRMYDDMLRSRDVPYRILRRATA